MTIQTRILKEIKLGKQIKYGVKEMAKLTNLNYRQIIEAFNALQRRKLIIKSYSIRQKAGPYKPPFNTLFVELNTANLFRINRVIEKEEKENSLEKNGT